MFANRGHSTPLFNAREASHTERFNCNENDTVHGSSAGEDDTNDRDDSESHYAAEIPVDGCAHHYNSTDIRPRLLLRSLVQWDTLRESLHHQ